MEITDCPLGMGRYHIFANMVILAFADTTDTARRYWIEQFLSFHQNADTKLIADTVVSAVSATFIDCRY